MNKRTDLWLTAVSAIILLTMPGAVLAVGHRLGLLLVGLADVASVGYLIYRGNFQLLDKEAAIGGRHE